MTFKTEMKWDKRNHFWFLCQLQALHKNNLLSQSGTIKAKQKLQLGFDRQGECVINKWSKS